MKSLEIRGRILRRQQELEDEQDHVSALPDLPAGDHGRRCAALRRLPADHVPSVQGFPGSRRETTRDAVVATTTVGFELRRIQEHHTRCSTAVFPQVLDEKLPSSRQQADNLTVWLDRSLRDSEPGQAHAGAWARLGSKVRNTS